MPVIIQSQFTSAVVEANMDIFTGSYTEGKYTVLEFDMRKRNLQKETGIKSVSHLLHLQKTDQF